MRNSPSADQILERVRGAMVPTEAAAARNFAGIEARLSLANSSAPAANSESTEGSQTRAVNPAVKAAPKALGGARAARRDPALAARIAGLVSLGLATGLVGYLIGRSQAVPPAATRSIAAPPAVVAAPATGDPLAPAPFAAAPRSEAPSVAPSPDSAREGASGASSAAVVDELRARSVKPPTMADGALQRSHARTAPSAALHRPAAPVAPTTSAASTASPAQSLQLADALELLRRAESAVRNSDGLQAQMWLGDLDRRAPRELLREERLATSVLAACVLGDVTAARAALAELARTNSESLYRARLDSSCAAPTATTR